MKTMLLNANLTLPSSTGYQPPPERSIEEIRRAAFKDFYYLKWARKLKNPALARYKSSRVVAIMVTQHGIVVVDSNGKIMNYSPDDWSKVLWQGQIQPPVTNDLAKSIAKFGVFHAAYDSVADRFYFVLAALYDDTFIYWASRLAIADSTINTPAFLDVLQMSEQDRDGRHFLGICVDAPKRVLYACSCDNDVSIWLLYGYDIGGAKRVGSVLCKHGDDADESTSIAPRFCAFHVTTKRALRRRKTKPSLSSASTSSSTAALLKMATTAGVSNYCLEDAFADADEPILFVAVSDFVYNKIALFSIDYNIFSDYIDTCQRELGQTNGTELAFNFVTAVTSSHAQPSHPDFIKGPCEVCFDILGNLFVADKGNDRLQIFAIRYESELGDLILESVWQSNMTDNNLDKQRMKPHQPADNEISGLWRVAIGVNPKMNRPSAIVAGAHYNNEDIPNREFFYFN